MDKRMTLQTPTIRDIEAARKAFETRVPRDLFYRAATELVRLTMDGKTSLTIAEALAVLLQTWNPPYYRHRTFDSQRFCDIQHLHNEHEKVLTAFGKRSIESFCDEDNPMLQEFFKAFEEVLCPVGAAKCLHLLAPKFFPLWDGAIRKAYGLPMKQRGRNADHYSRFMKITKEQVQNLGGAQAMARNPLKALDEFNYCRYTKRWI